ncbi:MAG: hypothetical protein RDU25_04140 [Patescibacteria group bacterium]|nr:hypothetical protein [Patescibacteria group bacterium]
MVNRRDKNRQAADAVFSRDTKPTQADIDRFLLQSEGIEVPRSQRPTAPFEFSSDQHRRPADQDTES